MAEKLNTWMVLLIRLWENNIANKFPLSICSRYFPLGFVLINFILYFPALVSLFSLGKYNLSYSWWSFEKLSVLTIAFSFLALDCVAKKFCLFHGSIDSYPLFKAAKEDLFKRVNNNKIPIIFSIIAILVSINETIRKAPLHQIVMYVILIVIFITLVWLVINFLFYLYSIKDVIKNVNNKSLQLFEDLCYKILVLWIIGISMTLLILLAPTFIYESKLKDYITFFTISIELIICFLFIIVDEKILKIPIKCTPNIDGAKIWFGSIINLFPFEYPMFIFISGYIFYFPAIIIINSNTVESYRWFHFVNLFLLGISSTFTMFRFMYNSLFKNIYENIGNIFSNKQALQNAKEVTLNYINDNKRHAIFSMPLMTGVFMGVILWSQRVHPNDPLITRIISDPALLYLIVIIYFAGAVVGTGISIGMRYGDLADEFRKIFKISNLNKDKLLISPDRTFGLKPLGNFIVKSALIWFFGLGLISSPLIDYMISFNKFLPIIYLIPVSSAGLITFFYVYLFIFNDIIKQLQLELIDYVVQPLELYEMGDVNKKINGLLMFAQLNEIFKADEYTNRAYNTLAVILSTAIGWIPYIIQLYNEKGFS